MSAAKKDQFEKIDRNIHNECWLVFFTSNTMASLDMRGCTCVFVYIVITLYTQSTAESRTLRGFQDAKMKNRLFRSPPIHVSSKRSKIQCVDACSMVQACISLLYNSVNKSCFLYDQDFTEDDDWDPKENWDYFYIIRGKYGALVKKIIIKKMEYDYLLEESIKYPKIFTVKVFRTSIMKFDSNGRLGGMAKLNGFLSFYVSVFL